ncbi:MAG: peptide chain release factor N(5)-glutamine methyltransferase [Myxococcales bacterium]|nr:peptide chain release factor N(5)-glutamine methyltransferase [Myxococcales bacterium]MCB9523137.1 peptide chain release factor N(5)-glutamine methyltransferase [Myxococcales bacterium]
MTDETWTLRRVLTWTTGFFEGKGLPQPRLDAELIIGDALGMARLDLYLQIDKPLLPEELAAIRARVKRRAAHEPVAYIVGSRGFWSLDLQVDARVLVPRPETELLVERALARLEGVDAPTVVDVGTGSGCVALALAEARPDATVIAVDLSPDALAVAEANRAAVGVSNLELRHGDVLAPVPERGLDLVVSNPPYIPTGDLAGLMPDVRRYEPRMALDGGPDGLVIIRRLIAQAAERLRPGGGLLIEIGYDQGEALRGLLTGDPHWTAVAIHPDLAGQDRVAEAEAAG